MHFLGTSAQYVDLQNVLQYFVDIYIFGCKEHML
jgi:hypothetical protein